MRAFYNEHDPKAARWLDELKLWGYIANGTVDARDIQQVTSEDLRGYDRHHFFAGIGGWDLACQIAGWPDDRPIWTASLPCQPFSQAGKQRGTADHRHLWPIFHALVAECRPDLIVGEQVASKAGRDWLAAVRADLEALGYAVGAADLCAAGVGAPHIRQRLYWCAIRVADHHGERLPEWQERNCRENEPRQQTPFGDDVVRCGGTGRMADPRYNGRSSWSEGGQWQSEASERKIGGSLGPWNNVIYLPCADGKARPIEPGIEPLVDGLPGRVGLLRGYGNAIIPQVAAVFLQSVMDILNAAQTISSSRLPGPRC